MLFGPSPAMPTYFVTPGTPGNLGNECQLPCNGLTEIAVSVQYRMKQQLGARARRGSFGILNTREANPKEGRRRPY